MSKPRVGLDQVDDACWAGHYAVTLLKTLPARPSNKTADVGQGQYRGVVELPLKEFLPGRDSFNKDDTLGYGQY
ncbi:MAG TPA: hypothetical protein VEV42_02545 [Pyrinomonadaceae bacterium]|nr:hypothetical protein [Pyrinomonadaceae bacterium]